MRDVEKDDAGSRFVRIDPDVIQKLELNNWDAIEITHSTSGKKTSALLYLGGNEDKSTNNSEFYA